MKTIYSKTNLILFTVLFFALATHYKSQAQTINSVEKTTKEVTLQNTNQDIEQQSKSKIAKSILELIDDNTNPFKKKREKMGSWTKSTIWIKNPTWTKKELV